MVRILLNGAAREVAEGSTVEELLVALQVSPKGCALEHNGRIVPRDELGRVRLAEGDQIELVRLIGGG